MDGIVIHRSAIGFGGLESILTCSSVQTALVGSRSERAAQRGRVEVARHEIEALGLLSCVAHCMVGIGGGRIEAAGTVIVHDDDDEADARRALDNLESELVFFVREYPASSIRLNYEQRFTLSVPDADSASAEADAATEEDET